MPTKHPYHSPPHVTTVPFRDKSPVFSLAGCSQNPILRNPLQTNITIATAIRYSDSRPASPVSDSRKRLAFCFLFSFSIGSHRNEKRGIPIEHDRRTTPKTLPRHSMMAITGASHVSCVYVPAEFLGTLGAALLALANPRTLSHGQPALRAGQKTRESEPPENPKKPDQARASPRIAGFPAVQRVTLKRFPGLARFRPLQSPLNPGPFRPLLFNGAPNGFVLLVQAGNCRL